LTSHFQHGGNDVISRRKVMPSGECIRSFYPAHMHQRPPAAGWHFRLQFLIHSTVAVVKLRSVDHIKLRYKMACNLRKKSQRKTKVSTQPSVPPTKSSTGLSA